MKLNSILIQEIDACGRVLAFSKSTYKPKLKPEINDKSVLTIMCNRLKEHKTQFKNVHNFVVTVSTTKGKFITSFVGNT